MGMAVQFRLKRILHKEKSKYFDIIVADTEPIGRVLIFREGDNYTIQSAQLFDVYDEMLAHVPMAAHPSPKKILIIGGGDGIVLREVLRYQMVEHVVLVEIDPKVVDVSRKYLRLDDGALEDRRLEIVYEDAARYIKKLGEKFDVILGDYSDPYQNLPASSLISEEFYRNAYNILDDDGILAVQAGSPIFQGDILRRIYNNARKVFPIVRVYWAPVIYYPGAIWTFLAATKGLDPTIPRREIQGTIYYNREIHKSAFILPEFIKRLLEGSL